ncbi:hypothetical protein QR680_001297 [Steinernema hermaphroditum]|uniref:Polycystin cation channel PKD1/PKD2 domain-containing protein n=1 Tax=Steinernema hermaphroditum TaxID=289476 RepID=A0AA39LFL5_9BILA|nr:hypothetical protein QR680_001297 [Steinernema hermaphroditum]
MVLSYWRCWNSNRPGGTVFADYWKYSDGENVPLLSLATDASSSFPRVRFYTPQTNQKSAPARKRTMPSRPRSRMTSMRGGDDFGSTMFIDFDELLGSLQPEQKDQGERLRRNLLFFFMDPIKKWTVRRQFPFKLALQILKIVFVTIQLVLFAEMRITHVDFLGDTVTVMRHKFLKDWDDGRDTVVYPPDSGRYSVYKSADLIENFAFIVTSYYSIREESFASFSYDTTLHHKFGEEYNPVIWDHDFDRIPPMKLCINRIASVVVRNSTYEFDISEVYECHKLNFTKAEVANISSNAMVLQDILAVRNITFKHEDALIISKATVHFNLRTIHFSPVSTDQTPECYRIEVKVAFDNSRHTGQVFIDLNAVISYEKLCNGRILKGGSVSAYSFVIGLLDIVVLLMCLSSLILCCRALIKAHLLKIKTLEFFDNYLSLNLSVSDQLSFLNIWYVMILVNDVFIIIGTVCKFTIEFKDFDNDLFTTTGILLGTGALLVYIGLLRYLRFFNQYNILILTIKKSLPNMLRFMVCAIVLYAGFLVAGWVIIGPYSIKFRTLAQSSEALFSLLNGDDMFATFYTINDSNTTIKVFGTIYIYIFVSLFIYVVLSLFIAIIMDAYEVVKDRYQQGLVIERSILREFVNSLEVPSLSDPEARAQFAQSQLLRLGRGPFA